MTRALALALVLLVACPGGPEAIEVDGEPGGSMTVEAVPDQEIRVLLQENASVGFEWDLVEGPDPEVAELVDEGYDADDPDSDGSGGTTTFTLRALAEGDTTLRFTREYRGEEDRTLELTVRVRESGE